MPGPDHPFATYLPGCPWKPRGVHDDLKLLVLHAKQLHDVDALAELRKEGTFVPHYIVMRTGCVLQLVPHRGHGHTLPHPRKRSFRDAHTISICVDGLHTQNDWPQMQLKAVSDIVTMIYATYGPIPVRDAANCCLQLAQVPQIDHWPWLLMHHYVRRFDTPLERLVKSDPTPDM